MSGSPAVPVTAGDLLTLEELAHFRRTSDLRGAGLVLHCWGVIAGAAALYCLWPSWITLAAAVVAIGGRQMGLLVLMHETAHWLLFRRARLNTWVGAWLCAAPLGVDLRVYRRRHHLHHRHTRQAGDPDLPLTAGLPLSRGRLALALAGDVLGWSALTGLVRALPWREGPAAVWRRVRAPLLANAVLCAAFTAAGGVPLYLLCWLLPWATWLQLASRVRDIAEHGLLEQSDDPLRNTRTIHAGLLARALLAPYRVSHHLEHHLLVFVPCWKLPAARALLLARNLGGRMATASGYLQVIRGAAAS